MKFLNYIKKLFILITIFTVPLNLFAQPVDPCTDPADPCPIDSNIVFLVVAAVIIAAKKAYSFKNFSAKI